MLTPAMPGARRVRPITPAVARGLARTRIRAAVADVTRHPDPERTELARMMREPRS